MSYEKDQAWLQQLMDEALSNTEEISTQYDDNSDDNEEDYVEQRDGDSESEQELESGETSQRNKNIVTEREKTEEKDTEAKKTQEAPTESSKEIRGLFYTGKDKITLWKKHCPQPNLRSYRAKSKNVITQLPGPKLPTRNLTDPVEIWKKFFDSTVIETIVTYTNQHIEKFARGKYSRETYVRPTDVLEVEALIGLLYLAGVKKMNRLNCDEIFSTAGDSPELFRLTMSQQRYLFLLRHLRFDDLETRDARKVVDKLAPIRDVFKQVNENCKNNFCLSHHTTIDEMLIAFRGKCPFRQYIPSKPAKYGVKIFALSDAIMFYTANMEVYVGKQPNESPYVVSNSAIDVVNRLVEPISGTRRNLTADNWFTSIELCEKLLNEHKLTFLGTIRKNKRQLPPQFLVGQDRPIPSSLFAFRENCTLVSHAPKPKKNVLMISSMHDDDQIHQTTQKPMMIMDYNKTKIGVDMVDQLSSNYNVARNTRRWPMVVLYALLNVTGINSFVIYKCNQKIDTMYVRRVFLTQLAFGLTKNLMVRRHADQHIPRPLRERIQQIWKIPTEVQRPNEPLRAGRCQVCTSKQNRKTKYYCKVCNKFLCLEHVNIICSQCSEEKL